MCGVCKGFNHSMADCPYVLYSANVAPKAKPSSESKSDGEEGKQRARKEREGLKAEWEKMKAEHRTKQQQQEQQLLQQRQSCREKMEKGRDQRGGDERTQRRDEDFSDVRSRARPRDDRSHDERPCGDPRPRRRMSDDGDESDNRRGDDRRRERERDERCREREYSRRDYARDRSSQRDLRYSDDEDDGDWTLVSRRRRRYDSNDYD